MTPCDGCKFRQFTLCGPERGDNNPITELRSQTILVKARSALCVEGGASEEIYIITEGFAFRYKLTQKGGRQILSFLIPGDAAGLATLYLDRARHSVQALTDVRVCVFPRRALVEHLERDAYGGSRLAGILMCEGARSDAIITDLGRRSAAERIARFALSLHARLHARGMAESDSFGFPFTQQHLADALGLTPTHIGRVLQELSTERLIKLERATLTLIDRRALIRIAGVRESDIGGRSTRGAGSN